MPSDKPSNDTSPPEDAELALAGRLLSPRPLLIELIGVTFFVAGVVALEGLPVTYSREALGLAYVKMLGTVLVISMGLLLLVHVLARRRKGRARPPLRSEVAFFLRVLPLLLFTMGVHFLLKGFILLMNPRQWDVELNNLDTAMHLGVSPGRFVTSLFQSPWVLQAFDIVYSGLYYFLIVISVAVLLTLPSLRRRLAFAASFSWLWMVASIVYLAFPSWGPVFIWTDDFALTLESMPLTRTVQGLLFEELSSLLADPLGPRMTRFGCVAAFPSVHVAIVSLFTIASRECSRVWFRFNLVILTMMVIGSVLTGYHYLVDAWAGIAIAAASWALGNRWSGAVAAGLADGERQGEASAAERGVADLDAAAVVDDDLANER